MVTKARSTFNLLPRYTHLKTSSDSIVTIKPNTGLKLIRSEQRKQTQKKQGMGMTVKILRKDIRGILAKIISKRIKEYLESLIERKQSGFCSGFSCSDHINTLRIAMGQVQIFTCFRQRQWSVLRSN